MVGRHVRASLGRGLMTVGMLSCLLPMLPITRGDAQSVAAEVRSEAPAKVAMVTIDVTNAPLEQVLRMIATRANLRLVLSGDMLPLTKRISLHARGMLAGDAFNHALAGTGLRAEIVAGNVLFKKADMGVAFISGHILGTVIDATSKQPVRGVTVTLVPGHHTVATAEDGTFRFDAVASGVYTLSFRRLGYVKVTRAVTVTDDQTSTAHVTMSPSVSALDQVIVTGTIVATAQREVPNAMTVITAKDLEQRGITRIDQLFRGDVPGVFAMNQGSGSPLDQVVMFSRGATALSSSSAGTYAGTNPMKTYVDGVELADPQYLSQIDPKSIERIEIVTGPQASTIYGSNAINGVMQVFTKRGTSSRPQLTLNLQSGWVENNFNATRTPQHDDAMHVDGVESHWAYNAGGSWNYMGPWTPAKQTSRLSSFGGARVQRGVVTADASLRLATTRTRRGEGEFQGTTAFRERGWYTATVYVGNSAPTMLTLVGQTLGLTLGVTPMSWWSHELVLGADRSALESRGTTPGVSSPSDTLLALSQNTVDRRSLRYASTVQIPITHIAQAVVTIGADAWQSLGTSLTMNAPALTGTLTPSGTPTVTRQPGHNTGGFLQTQIGFGNQLFVTYGLRAEWNPNYGEEAQPNWAPRYGMAYTRDIETPWGSMTAKLRASYGRSTRPPGVGLKAATTVRTQFGATAITYFIPYYGDYDYVMANPELGPEHQQGGEGGVELYLGHRGSLVVTRYNQTVERLIAQPLVDSVRSLDPNIQPFFYTSCDAEGYCYYRQFQNLNVGNIRNQGWELQSTINVGPLTTRGTYSWTKSRTIGVDPRYPVFYPQTPVQYQRGASFANLPEHTWSGSITYAHARSMIALNFSGIGMERIGGNAQYATSIASSIRLTADRARLNTESYAQLSAGYVLADLNASQRFSPRVEGVVQVQNLGDVYHNDANSNYATLGRQTKLGLRLRL